MTARTESAPAYPDAREELLSRFSPEVNPLVALGHEIGPDGLDAVLRHLGPGKHHIPDPNAFWEGLERRLRNERIRAEFNGQNIRELSERYGISRRWVRDILAGKK